MAQIDLTGPVTDVAHRLVGAWLWSAVGGEVTVVKLTEVEAYGGADDPASHAHRGRTERNASMFATAGTLYTYRSYGIHTCANVATGAPGEGSAVLFRAGEPVSGTDVMARRRGRVDHLADGPGKLCQALGIGLGHDGVDLLDPDSPIRLLAGEPAASVEATPRIGISKATHRRWRFIAHNP